MAVKLNKDLEATRGEVVLISNLDAIILPPDDRSGRMFQVADVEVEKLANSIARNGQQQPITVRKIDGDNVELVAGRNRLKAIKLLRSRGDNRPIRAEVVKGINDEEHFLRTIDENLRRSNPSPADDAYNQRRLREVYGWTDKRIAEYYECSVSKISQLTKLLTLPKDVLEKVHVGDIALATALDLTVFASEPEQLQAAIELATDHTVESGLAEAVEGAETTSAETKAKGKKKSKKKRRVNGAVVKQLTRQAKSDKGQNASRTSREIREFFEAILGGPAWDPAIKAFAKKARDYCKGVGGDKALENALDALLDAKRTKS